MVGWWDGGMVGRWDGGMVGWWDGGTVGWWDGGMVGRWDGGMVGWWDVEVRHCVCKCRNTNSPAKLYARVALNAQGEYWQAGVGKTQNIHTYIF